jgi:hypothetical protein
MSDTKKGIPSNGSVIWKDWLLESETILKELYFLRYETEQNHVELLKKLFLKVNKDMNLFHFNFEHLNKIKH